MRRTRFSFIAIACTLLLAIVGFQAQPTRAGDITLINNAGATSSSWVVEGEPTLVMNGFDLSPLNLTYPVTVDTVTLAVQQPVAEAVQVVIYEDGNGCSPIDARLIRQTTVTIQTAGVATIRLPEPVTTNAPVIWVGFYLPVGFRFFADESGSSVLTYWGWSPGTTFALSDLGSAAVFGPSDGTAPVNIDLGGIARITAEITDGGTVASGSGGLGSQIQGSSDASLDILQAYPFCGESLRYDPDDIRVTAQARFTVHCRLEYAPFSPGDIRNDFALPGDDGDYFRRDPLYEIFAQGDYRDNPQDAEKLRVPVTHCLRPQQGDLDRAIIGLAYGVPRAWEILPSQRYGDFICAEVTHQGYLSLFVPRSQEETALNVDLQFVDTPILVFNGTAVDNVSCGETYSLRFNVINEGLETAPASDVLVQFINDRTGIATINSTFPVPPIDGGDTVELRYGLEIPLTYFDESHTLFVGLNGDRDFEELNAGNNTFRRMGIINQRDSDFC